MSDKYDEEIAVLTEYPECINDHWADASPLFQFCAPNNRISCRPAGKAFGCLTQIRRYPDLRCAATPELTAAILADDRLPNCHTDITVDHLPVFAEWQRRLDRELNRP